jgi:hypothetical protein
MPEEFRRKAAECRRKAAEAGGMDQDAWLRLAEDWDKLARGEDLKREWDASHMPIDTTDYESRFGRLAGRTFWSFRIVSADPAIRDHVFTTRKPVIFQEACREARELAKMRQSEKIILVSNR